MKDPYTVLRQKEQDVERVRREIQALFTVIPLLVDDQPSSDSFGFLMRSASSLTVQEPSGKDMADLETYYPWIRHLRESGRR
jgi:hypothetical protein